MNRHLIEIQIERADQAIVAEDFDTLLKIYYKGRHFGHRAWENRARPRGHPQSL
jgi:hypothetical protein